MQAGNCCLNSTRLSFLLVNLSLSCLLTKRDYRHVRFGFALQWYVISRPMRWCKLMIVKLASTIYTVISLDYLETIWKWSTQHAITVLEASASFSYCSKVAAPTLIPRFLTVLYVFISLMPGGWDRVRNHLFHCSVFPPFLTKCHVNLT